MNQEEIIAVQQYENALSRVDQSVDKITVLMSSAQSLAQQGTQIMNCFAQLKREQQAYEAQFNELKLKLQSDLIKFQNIVKADLGFLVSLLRFMQELGSSRKIMVLFTSSSVSWVENSMVKTKL